MGGYAQVMNVWWNAIQLDMKFCRFGSYTGIYRFKIDIGMKLIPVTMYLIRTSFGKVFIVSESGTLTGSIGMVKSDSVNSSTGTITFTFLTGQVILLIFSSATFFILVSERFRNVTDCV